MRSDRKRSRDRSRSPRRRRSPDRHGGGRSRHHSESSGVFSAAAANPFFDPSFFAHMQQAMLAASSQNAPFLNTGMNMGLQQMGATMAQLAQLGQMAAPPSHQPDSSPKRDWIPLYIRHGNASVNPRNDNLVVFEGPQAEQIIPRAVKLFSISAQSNVKNIAGSIAHTCRRCAAPVLMAVGEAPINQAVKGASIARDFLAQDDNPIMDICVQPEFRSEGGMFLILFKTKIGAEMPRKVPALPDAEFVSMRSEEDEEKRGARIAAQDGIVKSGDTVIDASDFLRVAHGSDPHIVAGAIAKKIRRSDTVDLLAIGGAAVSVAVKAIAYARMYLVENCVSLHYVSSFVHLKLDTEERSGIRFMLCPKMVFPKFPSERITKAIGGRGENSEEKNSGESKEKASKFSKRDKSSDSHSDDAAAEEAEEGSIVKAEDSPPENSDEEAPVLKPEKKRRAVSPKASPKRKEKLNEKVPRNTSGRKKDKEDSKRRTRDRSASLSSEPDKSD